MVVNLRGSEGRAPAAGFSGDWVNLTSTPPYKWQPSPPLRSQDRYHVLPAICCTPWGVVPGPFVLDWPTKSLISLWFFPDSFSSAQRPGIYKLRRPAGCSPTHTHHIYRPPGQNHIQTHPWISAPIPTHRLHRPVPHPSVCVLDFPTRTHGDSHIHFDTYFEFSSSR